ncbi:sterile alpha motif domain-containing protein 9-like [Branchiostoma lanceolatum]|uniref:sterile alpha motif domain-containing protein 9-like n=1 Tax=Branchiostoma lanceolatum TaxID=7740 RepID=UPI003454C8D8
MGVDLATYRARIGSFRNPGPDSLNCWAEASCLLIWVVISQLMLKLAGDVEENPGPKHKTKSKVKKEDEPSTPSVAQCQTKPSKLLDSQPDVQDHKQKQSGPIESEDALGVEENGWRASKEVDPQRQADVSSDWASWSVEDVATWLKRIGIKDQHVEALQEVEVDGELLKSYTVHTLREDLAEVGHKIPPGPIRKIINARDRLSMIGKCHIRTGNTESDTHSPGATIALTVSSGGQFEKEVSVCLLPDGDTVKIPLCLEKGANVLSPASNDCKHTKAPLVVRPKERTRSQVPMDLELQSKQTEEDIKMRNDHVAVALDKDHTVVTGTTLPVPKTKHQVPDTAEMMTAMNKKHEETFRKFDKDVGCNYCAGQFFPRGESGADASHVCHEYKLFTEAAKQPQPKKERKYLNETMRFACGCLNERINGTIHFGVDDNGKIIGFNVTELELEKQIYCDSLSNGKEKMFDICPTQVEAARHCIREPKFVPVVTTASLEVRYVMEVDIVPSSEYCKDLMFKVALIDEKGTSNRLNPTVYRRFKAATQSLKGQKKENEFKLKILPGNVESLKKREQNQSSIVPSGQSLDKAKEFKKLLCVGEKTLEGFVHRILVANGPEYPKPSFEEFRDLYDFIVDIPFTAVFDFDAESTTNGLHKLYDSLMTEREDSTCNVRILEPDSFSKNIAMTSLDFYQDTNFPKEVCWIMSNGWINSNSNKREEPMDLQQWTEARGRGITEAMIKYTDPGINQEGRVLIVFFLLSKSQIDIIAELFHTFCMRIGLESLMVLTPSEQYLTAWLNALQHRYKRDDIHRRAVVMPPKHIGIAVSQLKGITYAKQCFVQCSTGIIAHLDRKMKTAIKDLEVLSVSQCTDTAGELKKDRNALRQLRTDSELSFYRGNKVEWWNFFFNQVAKRDVYDDLNRYINNALSGSQGRKISVIAINHQPGAGGSTLAMHALWEFRHRCRCVVIKKSQPDWDTASQLMKLYAFHENDLQQCLPILALVEDVDEDAFCNFLSTLSGVFSLKDTAQPACIVLYCGQTELAFQPKKLPVVHLELKLSEGEQDWFRTKFEQLEVRNIPEISLEDMMSFNLFKEGFNEDYVRRTVSKYLDRVTPKERELISYIALLNVFLVDKSLPALLCDTFMPGGSKWEQKLSEAANILLMKVQDSQSSIGAYKVKHPKIAEETLNQAIHDRQALSLITEHFLKCSMFKERSFAVKYLMEMTDQIFKHRTWKQTSHQAERSKKKRPAVDVDPREEGDEERETFSALVQRIITQEDCEAAVHVLEIWYDVKKQLQQRLYPKGYHEDPMIFQQIARIYMYAQKHNDAHHWADEALSLCIKENSYLLDTKGHIYKAEFVAQINKDTYEPQSVTDIAFKAIDIFRKAQNANKMETSGFNTAPYFGELFMSFSLFRLVYNSTSHDRNMLREFLLTGQDPPNFVLEVWGTYTEQLRCQVLNIRNTMDYLSEIQTIYKEDDELASFDSEFRKLLLAKRKLQKYIELYIKYFGEYEATPPSYIRHPPDMCNWRRRKVICKNGNNFREVFQMAKDQKYDDLREIRKLLGQNEPKTCFDLQHLIAVMLALSRHESPEEAIMSYMEVVKLSEEFVQVYHDHDISRMKAFFYVTMLMWPRKEMLLEFNLSLFERYLGELSELGKSTLFYRGNQLQHGRASGFRPAKKVYFYLGKGLGLHAFIHVTHFSGDDRERGMIPFWESPQAKDLLRRVNGRLIEYNTIHAVNPFNPNKPIRVQLARPERERFVNRKPVNFILGFSWSGPLAFNVLDDHIQEETPEITESVIYELEEEAASASGGMDFGSSMVPSDYTGVQERFPPYSGHVHRPQDTRRPMPTYREPTGTPPQENSSTKRIRCTECNHLWNVPAYFTYYYCKNPDCKAKLMIRPSIEM